MPNQKLKRNNKLRKQRKSKAILVGPFVGELEWEMIRFAPYIIHLKKQDPSIKIIVYTRPSRFDLYGKFSNILVPLKFKNLRGLKENGFGLDGLTLNEFLVLKNFLYNKYKERFEIIDHIYPAIEIWRKRIKWQFPRNKMDYNFQPRSENYEVIGYNDSTSEVFVASEDSEIRRRLNMRGYSPFMLQWLKEIVSERDYAKISMLGCLMVFLKKCKFTVGNISSPFCKLSLLLKVPVISVNEQMTYDAISLINPFNTLVINCNNIDEGVDIYENSI
jgi:hypothetical protein